MKLERWFSWPRFCCMRRTWVWILSTHVTIQVEWHIPTSPALRMQILANSKSLLASQSSQNNDLKVQWEIVAQKLKQRERQKKTPHVKLWPLPCVHVCACICPCTHAHIHVRTVASSYNHNFPVALAACLLHHSMVKEKVINICSKLTWAENTKLSQIVFSLFSQCCLRWAQFLSHLPDDNTGARGGGG